MKVNLKNKFKLIKALLKRNAFSLSCFLLAVLVCITGTLSYSRYISSAPVEGDGAIGSFTVSSEIDSVSALSFTNTAFWGGTSSGGTEVAMNALRSIEFSVRNYEEVDGVQKVAEVKTGYSLTFAAPVNFIDRLAFQVFDADEYPILPQFVTEDFLREVHTGEHDYDTGLSKDYHGIHTAGDLVFKTSILSDGSYLASSVDIHGHNVSVKFTPYTDTVHQQLMFRTWDVWKLTDKPPYYMDQEAGGTLLAPLVANYVQVVDFYRVTVSSDAFVMPAGEPVVKEHCIHLTPTHPINDKHLGAHLVDENEQLSTLVYGGPDNNGVLPYWTLKTTREDYKDAYYVENKDGKIDANDYVTPLLKDDKQIVIEYSENILGHPIPYEFKGEWEKLDEEKTETMLQNVTSHVGGTWKHKNTTTENFTYLYLELVSGSTYKILGTDAPTDLPTTGTDGKYYRIELSTNGGTKTTVITEEVQRGNLKEVRTVNESYYVKSHTKDTSTGIETIELLYAQIIDLVETVTGNGTYTETTTYELADDAVLQHYENASYFWWSPDMQWVNKNTSVNTLDIDDTETITKTDVPLTLVDKYHNENYFKRNITRQSFINQVQIESMEWSYFDASNNQVSVEFTYDSPFDLMQDYTLTNGSVVKRQKYFLSECYSKNFPFSVNVLFVQLIE